jgi:hypothetical protein
MFLYFQIIIKLVCDDNEELSNYYSLNIGFALVKLRHINFLIFLKGENNER